ncbi:50S ribosomal protein L13 [archaeon]|nr:50S ribosomal protein L13 [archaeon]
MKIIDAQGAILGRLSAKLAKALLKGEKIIVVNAEQAIMTGSMDNIYAKYKQRLDRSDRGNPTKGPHFPRTPDKLFKRTVRGMLNYRTERGKRALDNLKVYIGTPTEYQEKTEKHDIRPPRTDYVTISELCQELGWRDRT